MAWQGAQRVSRDASLWSGAAGMAAGRLGGPGQIPLATRIAEGKARRAEEKGRLAALDTECSTATALESRTAGGAAEIADKTLHMASRQEPDAIEADAGRASSAAQSMQLQALRAELAAAKRTVAELEELIADIQQGTSRTKK